MFMKFCKVAIHGVPRSGTTWFGELINSSPNIRYKYQPLFSYRFKNALSERSSAQEIELFMQDLFVAEDDFLDQYEARKTGKLPVFEKQEITHLLYKEVRYHHILHNLMKNSNIKLLCIIRSPLAVINSWLRAPKEFRKELGWRILEEWRFASKKNMNRIEEFNGYEKWKEAMGIFFSIKERYRDRVFIIEYARLIADTRNVIEALYSFLGLELGKQTLAFINESTSHTDPDAYSVFKKRDTPDDFLWKSQLDNRIVKDIVHDLYGTYLQEYLYLS